MSSAEPAVGATFLAFAEKRPHLRAIDLPSGAARKVEGTADAADAAFSHIWRRDGWLALRSHQELWSLHVPPSGSARLLLETWDSIPHEDGKTVWVEHPSGAYWTTCDGSGNFGSVHIARFEDERLEAVFGDMALVRKASSLVLRARAAADVECGESYSVLCQLDRYAVVSTELGAVLDILDLATGTRRLVERRGFGRWGLFASPSPDDSVIAIGCDVAPAPKPKPPDVPIDEWLRRSRPQEPIDDRNVMVFISSADWSARIVSEPFRNFASRPTWTAAGDAVAFDIPFEKRIGWLSARPPYRFDRIRARVMPLLDATDLVGNGIY